MTDEPAEVWTQPDDQTRLRTLLAFFGTALTAAGQPINEVEDDVRGLSCALGWPDAQVAAAPTGISVCLASGQPATYESVNGPLRLDQSADLVLIRHQLLTGTIGPAAAIDALRGVRGKSRRYPRWTALVGWVLVSTGITCILQPGWPNLAAAAIAGLLVAILVRISEGRTLLTTLLPTVAAFLVACVVFGAASAGWLDGPLRTLLPPLAVLLPGALLVTGISELAAGAMVAGSSRLVFGTVQLLLFTLGVIAAARLIGLPPALLTNQPVDQLGLWSPVAGLLTIGVGICLLESISFRLMPWILAVLALTFATQTLGQYFGGPTVGPFLGAIAATLCARIAELIKPTLPRLVVFLPSFWLLVPGSLGLLGISTLALDPGNGPAAALDVVGIVAAIALGLIVGATLARACAGVLRRRTVRRVARP